jgi:tRNA (guanine9-N1)-methyltransferase
VANVPLVRAVCSFQGPVADATRRQFPGCASWHVTFHEKAIEDAYDDKSALVYLTADSDTELATLEPEKGYIIGGLVDRNRYKRMCLEKAERLGIRTARLPISDHVKVLGSKALTVNQVVELLVQYHDLQDWGKACAAVVPARKTDAGVIEDEAVKYD